MILLKPLQMTSLDVALKHCLEKKNKQNVNIDKEDK